MVILMDPNQPSDQLSPGGDSSPSKQLGERTRKERIYAFDYAFDGETRNEEVFHETVLPLIGPVLEGYNATCFAYGMTGAGKTYTMMGSLLSPEMAPVKGVYSLTVESMFAQIAAMPHRQHKVRVSFLEIYNEHISDLLRPPDPPPTAASVGTTSAATGMGPAGGIMAAAAGSAPPPAVPSLDLQEDPVRGMVVPELSEFEVTAVEQVERIIRDGNSRRRMAATGANVVSSRSHAILQLVIESRDTTRGLVDQVSFGKLSLIDLAGSERAAGSDNRGIRMLEGANINRSLLALGNCINTLGDRARKGSFVPYRDSKLTRLLKVRPMNSNSAKTCVHTSGAVRDGPGVLTEAARARAGRAGLAGGNTRTVMVANVSPSCVAYEETHNTLKYASRAKNIRRRVVRNTVEVQAHISQYKEIIETLRSEISALKGKLQLAHASAMDPLLRDPSVDDGLTPGAVAQGVLRSLGALSDLLAQAPPPPTGASSASASTAPQAAIAGAPGAPVGLKAGESPYPALFQWFQSLLGPGPAPAPALSPVPEPQQLPQAPGLGPSESAAPPTSGSAPPAADLGDLGWLKALRASLPDAGSSLTEALQAAVLPYDEQISRARERRSALEAELHQQQAFRDSEAGQSEFNQFARDLLENFQEKLELRQSLMEIDEYNRQNDAQVAALQERVAKLQAELSSAGSPFAGMVRPGTRTGGQEGLPAGDGQAGQRKQIEREITTAMHDMTTLQHNTRENNKACHPPRH
ncbi:putative Kinesin-related protein 10 [Paratrimastix pyriformis]|uniref:Kinesin-like protein n=1 Tax=Paratrimastix pyriformis TaxID=342808 RepID=A0ABQ8UE59_9EUKA|nr:putative Kinesin-related protein 10 [Paratrimastix pyriformis]